MIEKVYLRILKKNYKTRKMSQGYKLAQRESKYFEHVTFYENANINIW